MFLHWQAGQLLKQGEANMSTTATINAPLTLVEYYTATVTNAYSTTYPTINGINYVVHEFRAGGNVPKTIVFNTIPPSMFKDLDVLVVAGGGAGGYRNVGGTEAGGGGGGGGVVFATSGYIPQIFEGSTYTLTCGLAGTPSGQQPGDSSAFAITAMRGGNGGDGGTFDTGINGESTTANTIANTSGHITDPTIVYNLRAGGGGGGVIGGTTYGTGGTGGYNGASGGTTGGGGGGGVAGAGASGSTTRLGGAGITISDFRYEGDTITLSSGGDGSTSSVNGPVASGTFGSGGGGQRNGLNGAVIIRYKAP